MKIRSLSSDTLFKNEIMQQAKKKAMINARMKINVIIIEAIIYNDTLKSSKTSAQVSNVLICQLSQKFDDDDIDKEYLNMNYANKLNVLTAVLCSEKEKKSS